ncbi:MAG: substrate-binding periplasmic protein [Thalassotalea sp.]
MTRVHKVIASCLFIFVVKASIAAPQIVKFHQHSLDINNPVRQYYSKLLALALTETIDEYGPFELSPRMFVSSQKRSLQLLINTDFIDVHWTMTTPERENQLTAVYIPLLKGLMGYRVLLIKKESQLRINKITTLEELKTITLGQGIGWPDSAILKANDLNVTLANSERLHEMLVKNRFDAFPRAVTEAWREISYDKSLTVDCCLLLQYISPVYFFVKKDNPLLAKRLSKGLQLAIKNGKFDELFFKYRAPKAMFELAKFEQRQRIYLQNLALTTKTKSLLNQDYLWFFPQDVKKLIQYEREYPQPLQTQLSPALETETDSKNSVEITNKQK